MGLCLRFLHRPSGLRAPPRAARARSILLPSEHRELRGARAAPDAASVSMVSLVRRSHHDLPELHGACTAWRLLTSLSSEMANARPNADEASLCGKPHGSERPRRHSASRLILSLCFATGSVLALGPCLQPFPSLFLSVAGWVPCTSVHHR